MFSKFNFAHILFEHVGTFRSYRNGNREFSALLFYFGAPTVWGIAQAALGYKLSADNVNGIVTAASIFAGLLLNLLVLLYTVAVRINESKSANVAQVRNAKDLLKESLANISFSIINSMLLVIACLVYVKEQGILTTITEAFIYGLSFLLVLSILMVLKRIHALLSFELSRPEPQEPENASRGTPGHY